MALRAGRKMGGACWSRQPERRPRRLHTRPARTCSCASSDEAGGATGKERFGRHRGLRLRCSEGTLDCRRRNLCVDSDMRTTLRAEEWCEKRGNLGLGAACARWIGLALDEENCLPQGQSNWCNDCRLLRESGEREHQPGQQWISSRFLVGPSSEPRVRDRTPAPIA